MSAAPRQDREGQQKVKQTLKLLWDIATSAKLEKAQLTRRCGEL